MKLFPDKISYITHSIQDVYFLLVIQIKIQLIKNSPLTLTKILKLALLNIVLSVGEHY